MKNEKFIHYLMILTLASLVLVFMAKVIDSRTTTHILPGRPEKPTIEICPDIHINEEPRVILLDNGIV